ncbi:hypothetical protein JW926_10500 [Candidatus Sumerlaeota bacterium]|nr:hypothetical protein [Candidatus Sumerlaeota bacterium]
MKDQTLERIWKNREAISRRCAYDPHRLVKYLQQRKKERDAELRPAFDRDSKNLEK